MKYLLSGLVAFLLLGAVMSTPAEARCWWNGWSWVCAPRYYGYYGYYRPWWGHHRWHRHYWHRRYW
jgi:hypothetical protein